MGKFLFCGCRSLSIDRLFLQNNKICLEGLSMKKKLLALLLRRQIGPLALNEEEGRAGLTSLYAPNFREEAEEVLARIYGPVQVPDHPRSFVIVRAH